MRHRRLKGQCMYTCGFRINVNVMNEELSNRYLGFKTYMDVANYYLLLRVFPWL